MSWPTPLALLLVVLSATATAVATAPALRGLPRPPGAPVYAALVTPVFVAAVGGLSGALGVLAVATTPASHWLAWSSLTTANALAIAVDARTTWLPLPLARAGWALAAAGVIAAAAVQRDPLVLVAAAAGAAALGGFFHVAWAWTRQLGYGDVRLVATVGAVAALEGVAFVGWSAFLGAAAGALWAIVHRWRSRSAGPFPYGPALLAGPFLALVARATGG